jgi:hypothetical protein
VGLSVAALDDAKELIGDWLESFQGTPDQMEAFNDNIKPLLTPYEDDPRVQDAITKFEQLTTACPNYQPNGTQTTTCQAAIDAAKAAYVVLQEFIDDLPPFPSILLPGASEIVNGRVATEGPDDSIITIAALEACANAGDGGCKNTVDPVRRYWGQVHGPGYEFWSVFSNEKKYYVMRTYESLVDVVYYYAAYGDKHYKVFKPASGTTAANAFADAASNLVFDVGVMMATGGAGSITETAVLNVSDAFVTALEESEGGNFDDFKKSFATNLLFSSLDFAEAATPILKNVYNKIKPNLTTFNQVARTKLNTLRTQVGWIGQINVHKNTIRPSVLPNYSKVIKGSLAAAFKGFSEIGAKIDHKNKQILDAGNKVIATFNQKVIKFTENVIPTGWTKKETLYDIEVEEIVNGVPTRRKRDIDVYEGDCSTSPNPTARTAAIKCMSCYRKLYGDFIAEIVSSAKLRGNLTAGTAAAETKRLGKLVWDKRKTVFSDHRTFKVEGVDFKADDFDNWYDKRWAKGPNNSSEAHHVLPVSVLQNLTKLQKIMEWDKGKLFDFASAQNGMMMLPVYNGKGHHSNTKRYADKIQAKITELLANIPEPFDPATANPTPIQIQKATDALREINTYIRSVKRQIEDKIIKSDNLSLKDLTID